MALDPNAAAAAAGITGNYTILETGQTGTVANTAKQRHPKTTYSSEYYFNKKTTSESGHEFEVDDTKGKERIRIAHKSGSYSEWSADGRKVESVKGHLYQYVQGGMTMTVDNNSDIKFNGNIRQSSGSKHEEIKGTSSTSVTDEFMLCIQKGASIVVVDDLYIVCKNLTVETEADCNFKVGGSFAVKAGKDINLKAGAGVSAEAQGGDLQTQSSAKTLIQSGSSTGIVAGADLNTNSKGKTNIDSNAGTNLISGGRIVTEGTATLIQSGGHGAPPTTFT